MILNDDFPGPRRAGTRSAPVLTGASRRRQASVLVAWRAAAGTALGNALNAVWRTRARRTSRAASSSPSGRASAGRGCSAGGGA